MRHKLWKTMYRLVQQQAKNTMYFQSQQLKETVSP
jgi:hypothetical protein